MYKNLAAPGILMRLAAGCAFLVACALAQPPAPAGTPLRIASADGAPLTGAAQRPPLKARAALLDNEGHDVPAAGQTRGEAHSLNMNFLVQGVQGKLNHSTPRSS